jgi:hypothetical protein
LLNQSSPTKGNMLTRFLDHYTPTPDMRMSHRLTRTAEIKREAFDRRGRKFRAAAFAGLVALLGSSNVGAAGIQPLTVATKLVSPAGGDTLTFDLPNDYPLSYFGLRVSGNMTVGVANATAVQAGGISNIFKNVRVLSKNEPRLDIQGHELRLLNLFNNLASIPQTDPAVATGTNPFSLTLWRQFELPRMMVPLNARGLFPVNLIRDCQVVVETAAPDQVLFPAATTTLAYDNSTQIELFVGQVPTAPINPDFYLNEQVFAIKRDTVDFLAAGQPQYQINVGGYYRHLICYVRSLTNGQWQYDTTGAIADVQLSVTRRNLWTQTVPSIQADNVQSAALLAVLPGVFIMDWTRYATPHELLATDAMTQSTLTLTANCTGTLAALAGSTFGIIGARIFDNPNMSLFASRTTASQANAKSAANAATSQG